ncbi:aminoglycoside phosphotransferase family protein [Nocardia brevicatena]|uniref:aminoglycoside phosphotransferase family protein n=1 Tax=Nocardia brevicatena TaxID=37327 RepID=UPI001FDF7B76|nr:aminoglycoside phosphotransferase family protein [Nocardia brevicatena]
MTGGLVSAEEILERATSVAGIAVSHAVAIRNGAHSVFWLPGDVIARIGKPGSFETAQRELRISQWLNRAGVPTVEAEESLVQPIVIDDRPVTWWRFIPDHRPATPAELGAALRRLHGLAPPTTFDLPGYRPFAGLRERIVSAADLSADDRQWLLQHYETLRQLYEQLPAPAGLCVIHGDAWQGNLVVPTGGIPTFLDLDKVSLGRPEWDLIQLAVDRTDFNRLSAADYHSFVTAYGGHDMTTAPEFRIYADVQELRWTAFAINLSPHAPAVEEAAHRVSCLRGRIPKPWTWSAL